MVGRLPAAEKGAVLKKCAPFGACDGWAGGTPAGASGGDIFKQVKRWGRRLTGDGLDDEEDHSRQNRCGGDSDDPGGNNREEV